VLQAVRQTCARRQQWGNETDATMVLEAFDDDPTGAAAYARHVIDYERLPYAERQRVKAERAFAYLKHGMVGKNTPRLGTVSGYFDSAAPFVQAAAYWSGKAPAVYATLNPCNPALLYRAVNRLKDRAKTTTSDSDIVQRRWFPLDFDPVRPADISSTDAAHTAALDRAEACTAWLSARGWPAPVAADSGNGAHRLYRIDLPNDDASRTLLERGFKALALYFSDDGVKLDVGVANAARIWKVYGTMACKGDHVPERPHRLARLLDVPPVLEVVSADMLAALAALLPETPTQPRTSSRHSVGPFDVAAWLADHGLPVASSTPWEGKGTRWVLNPCPWNSDHTNKSAFVAQFANSGVIIAGCHHNGCQGHDWHALRDLVEPGWDTARAAQAARKGRNGKARRAPTSAAPPEEPALPYSDYTNAVELVQDHGTHLRYCHPWGKWLVWTGTHWQPDTSGAVMRLAKQTIKRLARLVEALPETLALQLLAHIKVSLSTGKLKAMIENAQSEAGIPVQPEALDTHPWLLNCANGTLDLQTGQLRPHDRADLLTFALPIAYDATAVCATWDAFLHRIMGGNAQLISFLQRAIGYALTGVIREHVLLILWAQGATANPRFSIRSVLCSASTR
jgi:D5 N terminal like